MVRFPFGETSHFVWGSCVIDLLAMSQSSLLHPGLYFNVSPPRGWLALDCVQVHWPTQKLHLRRTGQASEACNIRVARPFLRVGLEGNQQKIRPFGDPPTSLPHNVDFARKAVKARSHSFWCHPVLLCCWERGGCSGATRALFVRGGGVLESQRGRCWFSRLEAASGPKPCRALVDPCFWPSQSETPKETEVFRSRVTFPILSRDPSF